MRKILILALGGFFLASVALIARADTVILRDGTRVSGVLTGATAQTITFEDADGVVHQYKKSDVQSLEFGPTPSAQIKKTEILPAGTAIAVRTKQEVSSKSAKEGQVFSAQVEQDVAGSTSNILIPKGSLAEIVVRSMSSGSITENPAMTLDIQSVTVGGRRYLVSTTDLLQKGGSGIGMDKLPTQAIPGGEGPETLLGAAGGMGQGAGIPSKIPGAAGNLGQEAAIGGAVSAAGSAGTQILGKTKEVRVPAETVLNFKLDKPMRLEAAQ